MYSVVLYVMACALVGIKAVPSPVVQPFSIALFTPNGHHGLFVFTLADNLVQCAFHTDSKYMDYVTEKEALLTDDDTFQEMVDACLSLDPSDGTSSRRKRETQILFPGTKWCGMGSSAVNYDDLGEDADTDKCCRAHDNCPESIAADQTAYGITNTKPYTISSCECDAAFRNCLQQVGTASANAVELFFFETMRVPCLAFDHPETCTGWWMWKKCTPDTTQPKKWIIKESR